MIRVLYIGSINYKLYKEKPKYNEVQRSLGIGERILNFNNRNDPPKMKPM